MGSGINPGLGGGGIEPFPPLLPREGWDCDGQGLFIEGFGG